jgi:Gpi18-like mannosyltransferase
VLPVSDSRSSDSFIQSLKLHPDVWQPWLFSRLLIWVAIGLIAPNVPTAAGTLPAFDPGWGAFMLGDGIWYGQIATIGYQLNQQMQFPSVAFFPLYPIVCNVLMQLTGLPFVFTGLLVNNVAFLLALVVLHRWVMEQWGKSVAKWTIAAMAWFPLSALGTVVDAEGLSLLLTVLTLRSFVQKRYEITAVTGALATATRSMGLSLVPTLISAAWQQERSEKAFWAGWISLVGFGLFSLFCGIWFGDIFAFDRALQFLPRHSANLLDWGAWGRLILTGIVGPVDWARGTIRSIWFPIQFCVIEICGFLLWRFQDRVRPMLRPWLTITLLLWLWLLWPDGLLRLLVVVGGLVVFWQQRSALGILLTNYTFWSLLWVLFSSSPIAPERLIYGIVALPIGLGIWLNERPRWIFPVMMGFGLLLFGYAVVFAHRGWLV